MIRNDGKRVSVPAQLRGGIGEFGGEGEPDAVGLDNSAVDSDGELRSQCVDEGFGHDVVVNVPAHGRLLPGNRPRYESLLLRIVRRNIPRIRGIIEAVASPTFL
jgi:hypothetical protein